MPPKDTGSNKKDKEATQLNKIFKSSLGKKGFSKQEAKFVSKMITAAKKDGNVSKNELAVIKKEILKQTKDKNNIVSKAASSDPEKYLKKKVKEIKSSGGGSTGGGSTGSSSTSTGSNTPMTKTPTPPVATTPKSAEPKTPTRNVTDISSLVPQFDAEEIQRILFENLSAIELSKIERHDTIEGINQKYSIISNLSEIREKYKATKQLTIMDKFSPLTQIYAINIQDRLPQEDYLKQQGLNSTYKYLDENNQEITREKGYYYIDTNGDLVIELINLEINEEIEVLIDTNGTIYKVES